MPNSSLNPSMNAWKIDLITKNNPSFKDLSNDIGLTNELIKTLIDPESSSG